MTDARPLTPLGLPRGMVVLAEYDDRWPQLYDEEVKRLASSDPLLASLTFEHMGSTAVPGLCAKPIIDILAAYPEGDDAQRYIVALVAAGYVHRGEAEIPGREFFRRGDPRMYHIHLAAMGGSFWRDHIAFRDLLRTNSDIRDAYAALKTDLARRYPDNREAYIEGKGPFVRATLEAP